MQALILLAILLQMPSSAARSRPLKIMPLGDSITDGYGSPDMGGYRVRIEQMLLQMHVSFSFVGSQDGGTLEFDPRRLYSRNHEGHRGWKISEDKASKGLIQHVRQWLRESRPDVILLSIGTNNLWSNRTPEDPPPNIPKSIEQMQTLLTLIQRESPQAQLFVGSVVPTALPWNTNIIAFNNELQKLTLKKARHSSKIHFVDLYTALYPTIHNSKTLSQDKIHPSPLGYDIIANTWLEAMAAEHIIPR